MIRGRYYYFYWNLHSISVPVHVKTQEYHNWIFIQTSPLQRISTVKKPSIATLFEMKGTQHRRFCHFAVGLVYLNKSLTMCSSDFVFRKYKQDSAFCVSGVLQLTITGSPVTKNFPLLHLFLSDAMMAWRFYTPYDINCTNLHILTARRMSHILTRIDQLRSRRRNSNALVWSPSQKLWIRGL